MEAWRVECERNFDKTEVLVQQDKTEVLVQQDQTEVLVQQDAVEFIQIDSERDEKSEINDRGLCNTFHFTFVYFCTWFLVVLNLFFVSCTVVADPYAQHFEVRTPHTPFHAEGCPAFSRKLFFQCDTKLFGQNSTFKLPKQLDSFINWFVLFSH